MDSDNFQLAAERARRAFSDETWASFQPRERADAIYRELRLIDAGNAVRFARSRRGDLPCIDPAKSRASAEGSLLG